MVTMAYRYGTVNVYSNISNVISLRIQLCMPHPTQNFEKIPYQKIILKLLDLTPLMVLKPKTSVFIQISITSSTNAKSRIFEYYSQIYMNDFWPKLKKTKF